MSQSEFYLAMALSIEPDWDNPKNLRINSPDGVSIPLLPTTVVDEHGRVLGLVYSSKESLEEAIVSNKGVYYSRTRNEIWVKSPSRENGQTLLSVELDCDRDALLFRVQQHGQFCHENRLSCYQTVWQSPVFEEKLRIGIASGRSEEACIDLLSKAGIFLYKKQAARTNQFIVKTHLHHNVEVISLKPRDLEQFLMSGAIHMAVCFSDAFDPDTLNWLVAVHPKQAASVKIALSAPTTLPHYQGLRVLTEYPRLTKEFFERKYPNDDVQIIPCHGNVEQLVAQGYGDAAVAVLDSGKTLVANGLQVEKILREASLGSFWTSPIYSKFPRFFREVQNGLDTETIYFYSVDGPNGFMSNFYHEPVGRWKTSEHYYQAHKFPSDLLVTGEDGLLRNARDLISQQTTAKACYKLSWKLSQFYRPDWHSPVPDAYASPCPDMLIKDKVMWKALSIKFSSHRLLAALRDTAVKQLVEHALKDPHFGCGIDGQGKNMLGKLLMAGRDKGFRTDV